MILKRLPMRLAMLYLVLTLSAGCGKPVQNPNPLTPGETYPATSVVNPSTTVPVANTETAEVQASFTPQPSQTFTVTPTITYTPSPTLPPKPVVFAAIGDFGSGENAEGDVAKLIESWQPDFIITLGDNTYPSGSADDIDEAIGQFFHGYIYPYVGSYGAGADVNRFFPSLGNHDVGSDNGQPYYDYFTLPGNERYYDFVWGPVHLYALDNVESEPDGVAASSVQASWLKEKMAGSTSPWDIVYMHYPPYSSGLHGSTDWAQWPYSEWGAEAVLAGHDHTYERLEENGIPYFVNGLGGNEIYYFAIPIHGSQVRYNGDYGAMRITATDTQLTFEFINVNGEVVDTFQMNK